MLAFLLTHNVDAVTEWRQRFVSVSPIRSCLSASADVINVENKFFKNFSKRVFHKQINTFINGGNKRSA